MKMVHLLITLWGLLFVMPSAHALCVDSDYVNLRSQPNAKAKVTWVVGRYMPLVEVKRQGPWLQVKDLDGEKHWIHAKFANHRMSCVVVKSKQANLRSGPGSSYGQTDLGFVQKYATFKKVSREEDWLKLQDDFGQTHWAHEGTLWEARNYKRVHF